MAQQVPKVALLRRKVVFELPDVRQKCLEFGVKRELGDTVRKRSNVPTMREVVHQDSQGAR